MNTDRAAAAPRRFPWIQGLRAIAAGAVAFEHVSYDLLDNGARSHALRFLHGLMPWRAGVDLFFVISGFVIVHAAAPLFGTRAGPVRFAGRRLARIVPLYWLATTLFLALLLTIPGAINGQVGGAGYVLRSYLFVPARRPDGLVQPVLGLGWTLDFEMLFYAVLTPLMLLARGRAVLCTALALGALVASSHLVSLPGIALRTWADPIVGEFCAGTGLALLADRGMRLPAAARLAFVAVALAIFHAARVGNPSGALRLLAWGLPALLLVAAAVSGSDRRRPRIERGLERLGDASYAMYLVHPFVMRPTTIAFRHVRAGAPLLAAVALVAAQCVALLVHARVERPLLRRLRDRPRRGAAPHPAKRGAFGSPP